MKATVERRGRKRIDLAGKRFGKWLVLSLERKRVSGQLAWKCRCDCGTERVVMGASLRRGASASCGCAYNKTIDLAGCRFGRWAVLRLGKCPDNAVPLGAWWLCRCDCGTENNGISLRHGRSQSCDCLKKEHVSAWAKRLNERRWS